MYLWIAGIVFFIDILPLILLHIQYLFANGNNRIIINKGAGLITFATRKFSRSYEFGAIISITRVASSAGKGAPGWYSWGDYYYCKIHFNDESERIITCLMGRHVAESLEILLRRRIEERLSPIPFLWSPNASPPR